MENRKGIKPEYEKASEYWEHRRQEQERALTENQREHYDHLKTSQKEELDKHREEFQQKRDGLVIKEKNHLLENKPDLALRMLPLKPMRERYANSLAENHVDYSHTMETHTIEGHHQREKDDFLNQAEQQRSNDRENTIAAAYNERTAERESGLSQEFNHASPGKEMER